MPHTDPNNAACRSPAGMNYSCNSSSCVAVSCRPQLQLQAPPDQTQHIITPFHMPTGPQRPAYRCEASDLVAQPLGLDNGNLLTYPLVCVKVERETAVILLDNDTRSLLHGLGTHTTLQEARVGTATQLKGTDAPCLTAKLHKPEVMQLEQSDAEQAGWTFSHHHCRLRLLQRSHAPS